VVAQLILFENAGFGGDHLHVFGEVENLQTVPGHDFNDKASSLAIVEGYWQFFRDWQWQNPFPNILGPGAYVRIDQAVGAGANDTVTGVRPVELVAGNWSAIHAVPIHRPSA